MPAPSRKTQSKHRAAGKCENCGRRRPASATLCRPCLQAHNNRTAVTKAAHMAAHRCAWCGQANASGFRACDGCRERYNARRRKRQ
jgi:hypothetical protein